MLPLRPGWDPRLRDGLPPVSRPAPAAALDITDGTMTKRVHPPAGGLGPAKTAVRKRQLTATGSGRTVPTGGGLGEPAAAIDAFTGISQQPKEGTTMRKALLFLAVLMMILGGLFVATQDVAVAVPLATGTAACPVTGGSGTLNPGISVGGSIGGVKITFKGVLGLAGTASCGGTVTSPAGVHVIGGSFAGSGYYNSPSFSAHGSSCANFRGPDKVGSIKVTITWSTTGGPIANTVITYTANVASTSGPANGHDTLTLTAPTATKAGSFLAGTPRTTKLVTTIPAPGLHCVGATTAFKITGGGVSV